ncbi:hypothetical protein GF322_01990 [Candidatus Dependentiae bacterium]|nr:hypothetical protein [Candidatus Dependentiae bacterium]
MNIHNIIKLKMLSLFLSLNILNIFINIFATENQNNSFAIKQIKHKKTCNKIMPNSILDIKKNFKSMLDNKNLITANNITQKTIKSSLTNSTKQQIKFPDKLTETRNLLSDFKYICKIRQNNKDYCTKKFNDLCNKIIDKIKQFSVKEFMFLQFFNIWLHELEIPLHAFDILILSTNNYFKKGNKLIFFFLIQTSNVQYFDWFFLNEHLSLKDIIEIETYDEKNNHKIVKGTILFLLSCSFVETQSNLIHLKNKGKLIIEDLTEYLNGLLSNKENKQKILNLISKLINKEKLIIEDYIVESLKLYITDNSIRQKFLKIIHNLIKIMNQTRELLNTKKSLLNLTGHIMENYSAKINFNYKGTFYDESLYHLCNEAEILNNSFETGNQPLTALEVAQLVEKSDNQMAQLIRFYTKPTIANII